MSKKHRRTRRDRRRRALSQNFLVDDRVIERVVATADVGPDDLVVDLGAGRGALSLPIARTGAQVIAVELDPAWIEELRTASAGTDNLTPVHADIRDVELPDTPFRVIANPPYNMSTALVRRLLTLNRPLRDATLVLQKQTASRLASDGRVGRFSLTWIPWFEDQSRPVQRLDGVRRRPVRDGRTHPRGPLAEPVRTARTRHLHPRDGRRPPSTSVPGAGSRVGDAVPHRHPGDGGALRSTWRPRTGRHPPRGRRVNPQHDARPRPRGVASVAMHEHVVGGGGDGR